MLSLSPRAHLSPLVGRRLVVPEKYAVQHDRAGQHKHARTKSETVVKTGMDQHGADPGEDHDGQRSYEVVCTAHRPYPVARIIIAARSRPAAGQRIRTRCFRAVGWQRPG